MASAADRNARRRLQTLLADEDYGPKLARLRGEDERRVLRLVEQNRGKEARAAIDEADARRRARVRAQRRETLVRAAVNNERVQHRDHYEINESAVRAHLADASDAELRFIARASRQQLVDRAREPPRVLPDREYNPFWYH